MATKTYGKNNPKTAAGKAAAKSAPAAAKGKQPPAKPAAKTSDPAPPKAIVERKALPPTSTVPSTNDVEGEVDSTDIKLPYLSLVQGVGDLSALFNPGQFVLAGEIQLTDAPEKEKQGPPLELTIVWARKQFLEKVDFNSGEMGRIFNSAEEAEAVGLVTTWVDNEPPSAGPMLTCLVLVEAPGEEAGEDARFTLEYDGKKFAPCMWRIKTTAYNRAGKAILTVKAMAKNEPLCNRKFTLQAKKEKVGQNWIFTPNIRATGRHDAEFVEFVRENAK